MQKRVGLAALTLGLCLVAARAIAGEAPGPQQTRNTGRREELRPGFALRFPEQIRPVPGRGKRGSWSKFILLGDDPPPPPPPSCDPDLDPECNGRGHNPVGG